MKRRLFNLAAGASLLTCAAVVAVWVGSQFVADEILLKGERTTLQVITHGDELFLRQWLPHGAQGEQTTGVFHRAGRPWNLRRPDYPPGTPLLERWGFDGYGFDEPASFGGAPARAVTVPYWFLVLLTAVAPTLWAWGAVRRLRRRSGRGLCPACGYDLRATPDRCPECGKLPATRPAATGPVAR